MTDSERSDSAALAAWPRTPDGYCSCPYCTAIRDGRIEIPHTKSMWAQRMGAGR